MVNMYCRETEGFISSPLSGLLDEAVEALGAVDSGMNGYCVADWLMPTVFLRMTGAQEQKLKCINWNLGSLDLELRYQRYSSKMGEMSCYDDKKTLCGELLSYIVRNDRNFNPMTDVDRQTLLDEAGHSIEDSCGISVMKVWYAGDYKDFVDVTSGFKAQELVNWDSNNKKLNSLFSGNLLSAYQALYNHRNRCAHNSTSYQKNLPMFDVLSGPSAIYENYFIRFYVLVLLDMLFVQLYRTAVELAWLY